MYAATTGSQPCTSLTTMQQILDLHVQSRFVQNITLGTVKQWHRFHGVRRAGETSRKSVATQRQLKFN